MKIDAKINGVEAKLILDSELAISLISKEFAQKFKAYAIELSKLLISIASGRIFCPLGKITNLAIQVEHVKVSSIVHVIDTKDYQILAGNN